MADLSYVLYDTAVFDATGGSTFSLFTTSQGSSSGRTKAVTNMIGNGELPSENRFEVRKIGVSIHDALVDDDLPIVFDQTYLEVFLNNQTMLVAPLRYFSMYNGWMGDNNLAAAAAIALIGLEGDGYALPIPIVIPPGVSFKVEVKQGAALSVATNILVGLFGVLTRPDIR